MLIKNVPSNLVCLLYTFHNNRKLVADQWNFGFSNSLWIKTFSQWLIFSKSALTVLRLKLERDWFKRLLTVLGWKTNEADAYYSVVLLWYFKLVVLWKQKNGKFPPCRDKLMFRKLEFRLITVSSKTNLSFVLWKQLFQKQNLLHLKSFTGSGLLTLNLTRSGGG